MHRVVGVELTRIGQLERTARHYDHGAERAVLHQHGILGEVAVMAHVAQPGALAEGAQVVRHQTSPRGSAGRSGKWLSDAPPQRRLSNAGPAVRAQAIRHSTAYQSKLTQTRSGRVTASTIPAA